MLDANIAPKNGVTHHPILRCSSCRWRPRGAEREPIFDCFSGLRLIVVGVAVVGRTWSASRTSFCKIRGCRARPDTAMARFLRHRRPDLGARPFGTGHLFLLRVSWQPDGLSIHEFMAGGLKGDARPLHDWPVGALRRWRGGRWSRRSVRGFSARGGRPC